MTNKKALRAIETALKHLQTARDLIAATAPTIKAFGSGAVKAKHRKASKKADTSRKAQPGVQTKAHISDEGRRKLSLAAKRRWRAQKKAGIRNVHLA